MMTKDERYEALDRFFREGIECVWSGEGWDGGDIQACAVRLGLASWEGAAEEILVINREDVVCES